MKGPPVNYLITLVASKMVRTATGGLSRNPDFSLRRTLPMSPKTEAQLEALTEVVNAGGIVKIGPMQLAGLIMEMALDAEQWEEDEEGEPVLNPSEVPS